MLTRFAAALAATLCLGAVAAAQTPSVPAQTPAQEAKPEAPKKAEKKQAPGKAADVALKVGDPAPPLSVEEWVKGERIESLQPGHVYVVEFWATWCRPCRESIPHLSKLQTTYKDKGVTVIGVAGSEDERTKVPPEQRLSHLKEFVQGKGEGLSYAVAYDQDRSMARAWMQPAGQGSIPCAFLVDTEGKIAWVGHPMNGLDSALKALLAKPVKPAGKSEGDGKKEKKRKPSSMAGGPRAELAGYAGQEGQPSKQPKAQNSQAGKAESAQPAEKPKAKPKAEPGPAPTLVIGDEAPPIAVSRWLKGEPVEKFEKGKTYIVEFWAPWSSSCRDAIAHLTEVQKSHKDVKVLGISIWEWDPAKTQAFMDEHGEEIGYALAADQPAGADGKPSGGDGKTAQTWLAAAGYSEIPTAFIINGDGKIAWIGGPTDDNNAMDKVLDQVVAGKWDIQKAAAAAKNREKVGSLLRDLSAAKRAGDIDAQLEVIDKVLVIDPGATDATAIGRAPLVAEKFAILLLGKKDSAAAYAYGNQAVDGVAKDNSIALNNIAWTIVDPEGPEIENRDLKLALKAAQRADELMQHKDPAILDTLAKVYHDQGDMAKALEIQQKAAELSVGTMFEKEITGRLEKYKEEALSKGEKGKGETSKSDKGG